MRELNCAVPNLFNAAYVVEVPELPGCLAHGATRQDAIRNAEDAIRFWIKTAQEDGLEIPQS